MKELKEWDNIPRTMWVWDNDEKDMLKMTVVYIIPSECNFPVVALGENGNIYRYRHCAEIEDPKTRRMTNKELSRWLREKPTRECKQINDGLIYSSYNYVESCEDEEVDEGVMVREDNSEWRELLVEV